MVALGTIKNQSDKNTNLVFVACRTPPGLRSELCKPVSRSQNAERQRGATFAGHPGPQVAKAQAVAVLLGEKKIPF